jgi:hypothetical protein
MKHDLTLAWSKSSYSTEQGACCEVVELPDGGRAVRDSKNPTGPALMVTAAEWSAFTTGVRAGEFD